MDEISVLVVEDSPTDAALLREVLAQASSPSFRVTCVERTSDAVDLLEQERFDTVLLDLALPDTYGLESLRLLHAHIYHVPVIVVTVLDDDTLAVEAVHEGAQDFLVKGRGDARLLVRAIRYAIERHNLQQQIRSLSLVDELTGLYNRRGLVTLGKHSIKIAARTREVILLLYGDLDHFKEINDRFGHSEGDRALVEIAELLKCTFRDSDIIARIGGDEFVVLAKVSHRQDADVLIDHVREKLAARNGADPPGYHLAMSIGEVCSDPGHPLTIENLLAEADARMNQDKRRGQPDSVS